jgi:hypothetical protein
MSLYGIDICFVVLSVTKLVILLVCCISGVLKAFSRSENSLQALVKRFNL